MRPSALRVPPLLLVGAAGLALAGCSALAGADATPTPTGPPGVSVLDLEVGDCIAAGGAGRATVTVPVVDCAEPHNGEAYAVIPLEDEEFPGADEVTDRAVTGCTAEFTLFVGVEYAASGLDFAYYYPTATSWEAGDREILCLAVDPGAETVTGSLAGAAR